MKQKHLIIGILASVALVSFYVAVMSLDGGLNVALQSLEREWWVIGGIVLAFGMQVALYAETRTNARELKTSAASSAGAMTATTSAGSMLACCLHHAADVLPFVGLTAVATFLGEVRSWLFGLAYLSSVIGIIIMLRSLRHQRLALHALRTNESLVNAHSHGSR